MTSIGAPDTLLRQSYLVNPIEIDVLLRDLLAMSLYSCSMSSSHATNAQRLDWTIIPRHIVALWLSTLVTCSLVSTWSMLAVPISLCVAFSLVLVWKVAAYIRLSPVRYRHHSPASGV